MICIVLPTFNEAQTIVVLLEKIFEVSKEQTIVIVVDDGSTDGTIEQLKKSKSALPLTIISRTGSKGLGHSLKEGLAHALHIGAELIITMDADLSHNPLVIPNMVAVSRLGAGVVVGSRYMYGGSALSMVGHRKLLSWYGNKLTQKLLKLPVTDTTSGFRCYHADSLRLIDLNDIKSGHYNFEVEILYMLNRVKVSIVDTPIIFGARGGGKSKFRLRQIFYSCVTLIRLIFARHV